MAERVVITGRGIVSCLGNSLSKVHDALYHGRSGIVYNPIYQEKGLRCHLSGSIVDNLGVEIPRAHGRFMTDVSKYAYAALVQAIEESKLEETHIQSPRTGMIVGSGGISLEEAIATEQTRLDRGVKRIGPYGVTKLMTSSPSACLSTFFKTKGVNYSISSACATGVHTVGDAFLYISQGLQDVVFAGGTEEESYALSMLFDAMGALSTSYNDTPTQASRAFDQGRDGFVPAGGAGMLVMESLSHAKARGANILAEIVGYGFSADGSDMVAPSGEGALRCMQMAMKDLPKPDYINAHGTSTPVGDAKELEAMKALFGSDVPPISSTKSLTGHSLGATGAQELIYSLLMMEHGFIAPSLNIENMDESAKGLDIVQNTREASLNRVMSNSFGFGGTNCTMVLQKFSA